jgi:arylformamidase
MNYYDITVSLGENTHIWPSQEKISIKDLKRMDMGGTSNIKSLKITTHSGTHVDAPLHMIPGGMSVDEIPLETFIGKVQVVEIKNPHEIKEEELFNKLLKGTERIIFKTGNTEKLKQHESFFSDYAYITQSCAKFLIDSGIKLVGIDYLSVDRFSDKNHTVHKMLLGNGVVIIENLGLGNIEEGLYNIICMPMRIKNADGAPARVTLSE